MDNATNVSLLAKNDGFARISRVLNRQPSHATHSHLQCKLLDRQRLASAGVAEHVAARLGTRGLFRSLGWALTLALRLRGFLGYGFLGLPPLADSLPIAATLLTAALPATLRLPPDLVGTPTPPTVCRILTRRTAIPRLGNSRA